MSQTDVWVWIYPVDTHSLVFHSVFLCVCVCERKREKKIDEATEREIERERESSDGEEREGRPPVWEPEADR